MLSKVRHSRFTKAIVRSLRRHSHVVIFVALSVSVIAGTTLTIIQRVQLGRQQKRALEAMTLNPIAFIIYAIQMPTAVSPLGLDNDATSAHSAVAQWQQGIGPHTVNVRNDGTDDDFIDTFMKTYGQWSSQLGVSLTEIANRHCGSREFALMVAGKRDDESCGNNGGFLPQADGKLPIEPASCRAGFYADDYGQAQPSPSGNQDVDPDVGQCPGAKYVTLCPEGWYCPTPIMMETCPMGAFCPIGTDVPYPCPKLLSSCARDGLARPHLYYGSSFELVLLAVVLCVWWHKNSLRYLTRISSRRHLPTDHDVEVFEFLWRWRRRRHCCRWLFSSKRRISRWVLQKSSPEISKDASAGLLLRDNPRTPQPESENTTRVQDSECACRHSENCASRERWDVGDVPRIDLGFERLSLILTDGTIAIDNACGQCRAGRVTAIIGITSESVHISNQKTPQSNVKVINRCAGPSGAGKSCLLALLARRTPAGASNCSGIVRFNGVDARSFANSHVLTALVPQSDGALIQWMTVVETLRFYAAIRGQPSCRVDQVMMYTGLSHLAHSRIGCGGVGADRGLSGGERKRVHIATEIIANVAVLLLDEPLSGLDSTTSLLILRTLKAATLRGCCVATVLHQPGMRVWQQIDDCIVVAGEGRIAYLGPTITAAGYFEQMAGGRRQDELNTSPAEFIIDFVTESDLSQYEVELDFNAGNDDIAGDEEANRVSLAAACALIIERTTWWDQFGLFAWRCLIELWRHANELVYDVIVHGLAGALIGALYPHYGLRDAQQVGFMVQLSLGFTISISSARIFGSNRETIWQELSTAGGMGLRPTAYVAAKLVVAELPRLAIFVAAFLATWYPAASPPLRSMGFATIYILCLSASFAAAGAAHILNISQGAKTAQLSTVALLVACAVCSGVAPTLRDLRHRLYAIPAKVLSWLSYSRWLVEALFSAEIANLNTAWHYPPKFYKNPKNESTLVQLIIFDYVAHSGRLNALILVFLGIAFRVGAAVALVATNRDKMGLRPVLASFNPRNWRVRRRWHQAQRPYSESLHETVSGRASLLSASRGTGKRGLCRPPKRARNVGRYAPIGYGTSSPGAALCGQSSRAAAKGDFEVQPFVPFTDASSASGAEAGGNLL